VPSQAMRRAGEGKAECDLRPLRCRGMIFLPLRRLRLCAFARCCATQKLSMSWPLSGFFRPSLSCTLLRPSPETEQASATRSVESEGRDTQR
jgi:hypothetical protein